MDEAQVLIGVLLVCSVAAAFFVSASAGLGGSLIVVPVLTLALIFRACRRITARRPVRRLSH